MTPTQLCAAYVDGALTREALFARVTRDLRPHNLAEFAAGLAVSGQARAFDAWLSEAARAQAALPRRERAYDAQITINAWLVWRGKD